MRRLAPRPDLLEDLVRDGHRVEEHELPIRELHDRHPPAHGQPRRGSVDRPEIVLELLDRVVRGDDPGTRCLLCHIGSPPKCERPDVYADSGNDGTSNVRTGPHPLLESAAMRPSRWIAGAAFLLLISSACRAPSGRSA